MSLVTQAFIVERYGLRLNVNQIAEMLDIKTASLANQISANRCPIKTYIDGGRRWADYRDVAEYIDTARERAA